MTKWPNTKQCTIAQTKQEDFEHDNNEHDEHDNDFFMCNKTRPQRWEWHCSPKSQTQQ
jgi:hypothetical protein